MTRRKIAISGVLVGVLLAVAVAQHTRSNGYAGNTPLEVASVNLTTQTAAIAQTTLYTPPASPSGLYRFNGYLIVTAAGSGGTSPSLTLKIYWNDGAVAQYNTQSTANIGVGSGAIFSGYTIHSAGSQPISYQVLVNGAPTTNPTYSLYITVEAL